jgi:hypothetical protein
VAFSAAAPFLKKKAENPESRAAVTAALKDITGRRWRLSYELQEGVAANDGSQHAPGSEEEWLRRFMDEFDAEEMPGDGAEHGGPAAQEDGGGSSRAHGSAHGGAASSAQGPAHGAGDGAEALTSEEKGV